MLLESDLRSALATLNCPAQLILGAEDQLVPVGLAKQVQALNPKLKVNVLAQSAHLPFISHADEALNMLNALVRQVDGADAAG
jgi:pimeloyl-[acyl-carrier protein] methyl ester esterase